MKATVTLEIRMTKAGFNAELTLDRKSTVQFNDKFSHAVLKLSDFYSSFLEEGATISYGDGVNYVIEK